MPSLACHYENVSDHYESAFFYDDLKYNNWLMKHTLRYLELPAAGKDAADVSIVDLGGGTGKFTEALQKESGSSNAALCVDAFEEMLSVARTGPRLKTLCMDAVSFAQGDYTYSHVLMKELLHHIPTKNLPELFSGLYKGLPEGGIALTITRPQEEVYPFFNRAREIWRENQPDTSVLTDAMHACNFKVSVNMHEYKVQIPKAKWLEMVMNKFWSTFSLCTPQELADGLKELEHEYADTEEITFFDRVLFIVAKK